MKVAGVGMSGSGRVLLTCLLCMVCAACVSAAGSPAGPAPAGAVPDDAGQSLSIAAVNHGGVRDWIVVDDQTLLLQDSFKRWYEVRLVAPAINLVYAQAIGFVTGPSGALDRFGQIRYRGARYPIASITASPGPAPRAKASP